MKKDSLNTKIAIIALFVAILVSGVIAMLLYFSQIKPVKMEVEQQLVKEMKAYLEGKIDSKIQSGIIGSTMLSLQPMTRQALASVDDASLKSLLKTLKDDYAGKTNFRGVFSEIIDAKGISVLRSWKLDGQKIDRSQSTLVQTVKSTQQAMGALGFGERGVALPPLRRFWMGKV